MKQWPNVRRLGQHADRAVGRAARLLGDDGAHRVGQRDAGVAEVVAAPEAQDARAAGEQPAAEQLRQLVEVDIGHRDAVAELGRRTATRRWRIVPV